MHQNRLVNDGEGRPDAHPTTTQNGIGPAGVGGVPARKDSKTLPPDAPRLNMLRPVSAGSVGPRASQTPSGQGQGMGHKPKSSLGNLGRLAGVGVSGPMRKMKR